MDYYDYAAQEIERETAQVRITAPSRTPSGTTRSSESSLFRRPTGLSFDIGRISHESKPRLSKDQQDILERHFQAQPKPSTLVKKGFADTLNVPLDKINNWFQNRRAKVKHDAKKQQSANSLMYYSSVVSNGQAASDSASFIDPAFYDQMMDTNTPRVSLLGPPGIQMPAQLFEPLFNGNVGQYGQPTFDGIGSQYPQHMAEPLVNTSDSAFDIFFGLGASDEAYNNLDAGTYFNMQKSFSAADPMDMFHQPSVDQVPYASSTSASVFTQSSRDDSSLRLSNMTGDDRLSNMTHHSYRDSQMHHNYSDNRASLASHTSSNRSDSQFETDSRTMHCDASTLRRLEQQLPFRSPPHTVTLERTIEQGEVVESNPQMNACSQHMPPQQHRLTQQRPTQPFMDVQHDPVPQNFYPSPLDEADVPTRTDSAVSRLADSIGQVEMQPRRLESPVPKHANGALTLATRRRQPRPAALGTATLRTMSFNTTTPSTPNQQQRNIAPTTINQEANPQVRRIKSSAVLNGRIQKPNIALAQRSPSYASFSQATPAPQFVGQLSSQSIPTIGEPNLGSMDLDPMTPQSPQPMVGISHTADLHDNQANMNPNANYESGGHNWPIMPDTSNPGTQGMWFHHPQGLENLAKYTSPPKTPIDIRQQSQAPLPENQFVLPTSVSYPVSVGQPSVGTSRTAFIHPEHIPQGYMMNPQQFYQPQVSTAGEDALSMFEQSRRPQTNMMSDLDQTFMGVSANISGPSIHASSEIPSGHSRQQFQQQPVMYTNRPGDVSTSTMTSPVLLRSPSALLPRPPAELLIHEYSPREPADASRLPPRIKASLPKQYSFQNHGPEFFSSP